MNDALLKTAREYLAAKYEGVFDRAAIDRHVADYIGFEIAGGLVEQVASRLRPGSRILDIGSGFGSFVLRARMRGLDAVGIEIEPFEVSFSRERMRTELSGDDPEYVYRLGDATKLDFEDETFEAVTLWNVLEHVPNKISLLSEVVRVLRPGGCLHLVCPNYCSIRKEAHYNILWPGLIPRKWAEMMLRFYKKNPAFFRTGIFYTTNWGVLKMLKRLSLEIHDPAKDKIASPESIRNSSARLVVMVAKKLKLRWMLQGMLYFCFWNPFKSSIVIVARKKA